jgi:hypothetical protein
MLLRSKPTIFARWIARDIIKDPATVFDPSKEGHMNVTWLICRDKACNFCFNGLTPVPATKVK